MRNENGLPALIVRLDKFTEVSNIRKKKITATDEIMFYLNIVKVQSAMSVVIVVKLFFICYFYSS